MLRNVSVKLDAVRCNSTLAYKLRRAASASDEKTQETSSATSYKRDAEVDEQGDQFREMFVVPKRKLRAQLQLEQITGRASVVQRSRVDLNDRLAVRRPRSEEMDSEQEWSSVWPAARTFNASVVPLPVRMGTRPNPEKRAPFKKQGNLELVKIPNFLHLTPSAIEKHCSAIRKFCTEYPVELRGKDSVEKQEFPVSVYYNDFVHQGTSIRDNRARVITTEIKVSRLGLNSHQRNKLVRLAGTRYDEASDTLTIITDRCHTRKQNTDYANYLLTVLYHESMKVENWEEMKQREDNLKVEFAGSASEKRLLGLLKKALVHDSLQPSVKDLGSNADETQLKEHVSVKQFAETWQHYRNEKETPELTRKYGDAVRTLLGVPLSISSKEQTA